MGGGGHRPPAHVAGHFRSDFHTALIFKKHYFKNVGDDDTSNIDTGAGRPCLPYGVERIIS